MRRSDPKRVKEISIHALRGEGDLREYGAFVHHLDFYPRPPRGGRRLKHAHCHGFFVFLSTPSAGRATQYPKLDDPELIFLSTPSAGRATFTRISAKVKSVRFLSTPSAGRATS